MPTAMNLGAGRTRPSSFRTRLIITAAFFALLLFALPIAAYAIDPSPDGEFEVSTKDALKDAVQYIESYMENLPAGESPRAFTISLTDNILDLDAPLAINPGAANGAKWIDLPSGTKLTLQSKQGGHYKIKAYGNVGTNFPQLISGTNVELTVKDLDFEANFGIIDIRSSDAASSQDDNTLDTLPQKLAETNKSHLVMENCTLLSAINRNQVLFTVGNSKADLSKVVFDHIPSVNQTYQTYQTFNLWGSAITMSDTVIQNFTSKHSTLAMVDSCVLKLENCTVQNNTADRAGAILRVFRGIFDCNNSIVEIQGGTVKDNIGQLGGGFCLRHSRGTFENVLFEGNVNHDFRANQFGDGPAALEFLFSEGTVKNCTFQGNASDLSAGALRVWASDVTVKGGVMKNNTAESHGGAICVDSEWRTVDGEQVITRATLTLDGVLIEGNLAKADLSQHIDDGEASGGGAIYLHDSCDLIINEGTVIRNNTVGSEAFSGNGGGVFVSFGSTLTMNGGEITGNTSVSGHGGGVFLEGADSYQGHEQSDDRDEAYGTGAEMEMNDGLISGNFALCGGGIYIEGKNETHNEEMHGGEFTVKGGVITANRAAEKGGGIYLESYPSGDHAAAFHMSSGALYFNEAGAESEKPRNCDPQGAGAELYSEGGIDHFEVPSAEAITNYIQNSGNAYVPEKDRDVWFTSWYEDFDDAEAGHNGRYMNSPILKRVVYTPKAEDTRIMALILDRTTKLKVTKTVEGTAKSNKAYTFSLAFANLPTEEEVHAERIGANGQATELTILASNSKPYIWSMKKDESLVVDDLPPGTEFQVKETDKAGADATKLTLTNVENGTVANGTASGKTRSTWQGSAEATVLSQVDVVNEYKAYRYRFSFKKIWKDKPQDKITYTVYAPDGSVKHHAFRGPTKLSETEWLYEAWFASPVDYYVIEDAMPGYTTRYENVGEHADATDRVYNGGTIVNARIPQTGDRAPLLGWLLMAGCACGAFAVIISLRQRKRN